MSSAIGRISGGLRSVYGEIAEADTLQLATRLTLVYLLLKPVYAWYLSVPIVSLALVGLITRRLALRPELWLALALLTGWKVLWNWTWVDNHFFLVSYWCFALFCCLSLADAREALAFNGRVLVGLVFALATLWKGVLSPDFVDGTFFREVFLTDPRFLEFSAALGGVSDTVLRGNRQQLDLFLQGADSVTFVEPAGLRVLAWITTWWTLLAEGAIAVAFLWPFRALGRWRHALLIVFCWTTYAVGTVAGFGWILMAMAVAQCEPERRRTRVLYVLTFLLILLYARLPWDTVLDWIVRLKS